MSVAFDDLVSDLRMGIDRMRSKDVPGHYGKPSDRRNLHDRPSRVPLLYAGEAQRAASRFGYRRVFSKRFIRQLDEALVVVVKDNRYVASIALDKHGQPVVMLLNRFY